MASGGERTFREYAISPYDYKPMAASAETGEGAGNSTTLARTHTAKTARSKPQGEMATQTGEPDQMF